MKSSTNWLSLVTGPCLLTVIGAQSLLETLVEVGKASEEVFRGERLPVLKFPDNHKEEQYINE